MPKRRCPDLAAVLLAIVLLSGCAESSQDSAAEAAALEKQADELAELLVQQVISGSEFQDDVLVRLAFGAETDLDLYVTDPLLETLYFANHESKSGGTISTDVRCDMQGPRIETVRFEKPIAGLYRIGIDYPESCDGGRERAAYAVSVQGDRVNKSARGTISYSRFEVIVLEFEVSG
jgi:hypothetical protein